MEIKNKLTVTRGLGERDNGGKKEKDCQGTCIKDPWTNTTWREGLNVGGWGVGRAGESNGGNKGTSIIEQQ